MLDEVLDFWVEDLLELEDLVVGDSHVSFLADLINVPHHLDHLQVVLLSKVRKHWDAVLKLEGEGKHVIVNDDYILQVQAMKDT